MKKQIKMEVKNIVHYYESKNGKSLHALNDINLSIKNNEFLAIVGSSGCGKSTLLNIMSGMIKPSKGEVLIDGEAVDFNKHNVGYISQSDTLLPWRKMIDNVAIGLEIKGINKKERHEIARELMETSGLAGFENKYPYELSGGMRKRGIIMRALATEPDIIFMDEPFGPLDIFTKEFLQDEILKIWEDKRNTIIYITHDISEAITLADRIVLMSYRPSKIKAQYEVDIPRPRNIQENRYNHHFLDLEKRIRDEISAEVTKASNEEMMNK